MPLKKQAQKEHKSILRSQLEPLQLSYIPILQECRIERSFSLYNDGAAEPSLCALDMQHDIILRLAMQIIASLEAP